MANILYGVNLEGEITPLMVRDALALCFYEAHCADSGLATGGEDEEMNKTYCRNTVEKAFIDSGGDFEHPTKESILGAMQKLMEFSKSFRDPSIIERHASEIMKLVEKLKQRE